jgi:hypothetical protein
LASGAFGAAINTGLLIGVKTDFAGWALGDVLYPDPSTGGLTKTKPTSGTYQACAYIMRVQSNNGVLLCEFTEPQQVLASTATANTAVLRDGSGNFAAGTITAALTGNASTATALATARNINGVSFNGTADITVTAAAGTLTGDFQNSRVVNSNGVYSLYHTPTNTALSISVVAASLPGVQTEAKVAVSFTTNGLFPNVTNLNIEQGAISYRCLYLVNGTGQSRSLSIAGTQPWSAAIDVGPDPGAENSTAKQTANETVAPAGVTFSRPSFATPLVFSISANASKAVWLRRSVGPRGVSISAKDPSRLLLRVT